MYLLKLFSFLCALNFLCLACHSKVEKFVQQRVIECIFSNISESQLVQDGIETMMSPKKLVFFNATKPNIAILPCFENNVKFFASEPEDINGRIPWHMFSNTPIECQAMCQDSKLCVYFTYEYESNKCWLFHKGLSYIEDKFNGTGFVSGPKYCRTLQPEFKGGFKIEADKPWTKFNDTFVWSTLPSLPTHAWESCKNTCSVNKNCTSFKY